MAQALNDLAVPAWQGGLSRPRITTGSLACMVDGGEFVAIAINPSHLHQSDWRRMGLWAAVA
jgi:hypothetical protein